VQSIGSEAIDVLLRDLNIYLGSLKNFEVVRVNSCGSLRKDLRIGDVVAVYEAYPYKGWPPEQAGAIRKSFFASKELVERFVWLRKARCITSNFFTVEDEFLELCKRFDVVEMENATLYWEQERYGFKAISISIVSNELFSENPQEFVVNEKAKKNAERVFRSLL
jgi:purine-nucleoside phosphorylase